MMKRLLVLFMVFCAISTYSLAQNWVGTWATAPQTVVRSFMPYNNCMTNRSVRQVVKVSIGGDVIRLKLSNIYSMQPVEIRSIYIAHAKDSFSIDAKSAQYFKFGNSYKTVIPAGKQIEPLVQHQRHRRLYHEQQHECHRHHGQLHHRRQMLYG